MDMRLLSEASRLHEDLNRFDRLWEDLADRDIDFVEGGHRRPLGRNQMSEADIENLRQCLKAAAFDWYRNRRQEMLTRLTELGIDVSGEAA